ncbi:GTP pyrophosphokinase [Bogoriella caseilytica]|uniref:Putative GTP pyrophosphokinase n=1 Tax=Bogoriella caseilytica TaxID=56055 RepID=A0A3N2BGT9_9MICO|nr:GTP pyrophosphokinase family protein [Bogoriella caseilytica]ROR74472.1 putative GTP pyrophosphokinase [Bogoriella caseilytica]
MIATAADEFGERGVLSQESILEMRQELLTTLSITQGEAEELALQLRTVRDQFAELHMVYQSGIDEVLTKVTILQREFEATHEHSPIEHVTSRLKSPESLVRKIVRLGLEPHVPAVRKTIRDIAGIRITCSFVSDVYWIASMLERQPDLTILQVKDYVAKPKPNGYRSLHLILEVPIFLSDRTEQVPVEMQIRTSAMDFWASVEHKLSYKYDGEVPTHLRAELQTAAERAADMDVQMERLRAELNGSASGTHRA